MKNIFVAAFVILSLCQTTFGMFEAILVSFENDIKKSPALDCDGMKIKRFNRTAFVLDGTCELFEALEDWDIICNAFKKMGNEFKLLPYKVGPSKVCTLLKDEKMLYPDIVAHSENFPPVGTCDFKPSVLRVIDWLPDLSNVPPVFESGDYMVECRATKNDQLLQVLRAYAQVFNIRDAKPGAKPSFG